MSDRGPLSGILVVEMASWVMGPASAGILAAYGADVIKVEPAGSADPSRVVAQNVDGELIETLFDLANNRKRSMCLSLSSEAGRQVLHRLLARTDVFITNVRSKSLIQYGFDEETLQAKYPRLVCAHNTGYGPQGPDRDRAAYDELAYWARGGIAKILSTDDNPPVHQHGSMGDLPSAVSLTAGILLALLRREREGRGSIVDVSLYGTGMWTNAMGVQEALYNLPTQTGRSRLYRANPLFTMYRCSDDKWVQFAMYQTDRYWEAVCEAVGRADMITDEHFCTHELRCGPHSRYAIAELQKAIGQKPLQHWTPIFDEYDLAWSPIFDGPAIAADEQARVNRYIVPTTYRTGRPIETIAPPFQLRDVSFQMGPSPEAGQHTEEILLELGYDWGEIEDLRKRGAF